MTPGKAPGQTVFQWHRQQSCPTPLWLVKVACLALGISAGSSACGWRSALLASIQPCCREQVMPAVQLRLPQVQLANYNSLSCAYDSSFPDLPFESFVCFVGFTAVSTPDAGICLVSLPFRLGPRLLVSDWGTFDKPILRWRFRISGNMAVELGVVPLSMVVSLGKSSLFSFTSLSYHTSGLSDVGIGTICSYCIETLLSLGAYLPSSKVTADLSILARPRHNGFY